MRTTLLTLALSVNVLTIPGTFHCSIQDVGQPGDPVRYLELTFVGGERVTIIGQPGGLFIQKLEQMKSYPRVRVIVEGN